MSRWELYGYLYIFFLLMLGLFIVFSVLAALVVPTMNPEVMKITVIEKIPYHDGKYLITAQIGDTEREVFSVTDVWVLGIFDASDRYAYLDTNTTYTVEAAGYRVPVLSWYRNINSVKGE